MAFSEDVFVPILTIGNSRLSVVAAELHGRLFEALWGFHRAGNRRTGTAEINGILQDQGIDL